MKITKKELRHIIEEAVMDHMRTPYIGSNGRRNVPYMYGNGNQTAVPNNIQQNAISSNYNINKPEPQATKQAIRQEPSGIQNKQAPQPSNDNTQVFEYIQTLERKIDSLANTFQKSTENINSLTQSIGSLNRSNWELAQRTEQINKMLSFTETQMQKYERNFNYQCNNLLAALQQSLQQKRNNNSPHQIH